MANQVKITLPRGTKVPDHLAVIPDGNRRWARSRGLAPTEGHKKGAEVMLNLFRMAREWGIHTVTFWGLSTENWIERSEQEVKLLMKIIARFLDKSLAEAKEEGVRVIHLGRKDRLPKILLDKIKKVEEETKNNTKFVFNIALDYGGQDEIVRAVQKMIAAGVQEKDVNIKLIDSYLDTHDQPYPYPDLIIRTSGEQRTSGILLWQSHYAETYWEPSHLPDFNAEKLKDAVLDYSRRRRRFGGNDAQSHFKFTPKLAAKLELDWWRLSNIPEGVKLKDYAVNHIKEQFGVSKKLAKEAAKYLVEGTLKCRTKQWSKSLSSMKKFYKLIRDEIKLAFEPSLAASLQVELWKETDNGSVHLSEKAEDMAKQLYSEVYRISLFQAAKLAHLRLLAAVEKNMAEKGYGEQHWDQAEDYLHKFYSALKERVA